MRPFIDVCQECWAAPATVWQQRAIIIIWDTEVHLKPFWKRFCQECLESRDLAGSKVLKTCNYEEYQLERLKERL